MIYEKATAEVILFDNSDVITASPGGCPNNTNRGHGGGYGCPNNTNKGHGGGNGNNKREERFEYRAR